MALILAYTSPALGHLYPFCALLQELAARGHQIRVRTLADGVQLCRDLGFEAGAVDARIESLHNENSAGGVLRAAGGTVRALTACAAVEVGDIEQAVREVAPDLVIVDSNCWGAISFAEANDLAFVVFSAFTPYLRSPGSPPFGPGARPWPGPLGRIRDWGVGLVTSAVFDRPFRRGMHPVRAGLGLPDVRSANELLRRAPAVLVATGKPFEYPHTDWGPSVAMIGPASFDPPPARTPGWLHDVEDPIVLVTTSSVPQADDRLIRTAVEALEGQALHLVATSPARTMTTADDRPGVTLSEFVPHSLVLERAVCVITHGGMGVTQKALDRGIPVCAVPFGRDQFEVARRVEVARCGVRLPAKRLTPATLRAAVADAMSMADGAAAVARGFAATGGVRRGANIVESFLPEGDSVTGAAVERISRD
ncbi:glycosyltransferase [Mycobacterium sp. AMU20-3851]|uniref:glycosyltransferase n=1 Tax=Mycobacterium sp. AMU20-3851 TaxID=3122055 RepID=UPI003753EF43